MFEFTCAAGIVGWVTLCAWGQPLVTAFDDDGMITLNGKRTLIVGSYYAAKSDRPYAELAEAGFNLVHAAGDQDALDKAHAAGLAAWVTAGAIDPKNKEAGAQAIVAAVQKVKDHPALAFIETVDEPAWTWMKAEARVPWQVLAETYALIKQTDPSHLVYTNHAPTNLVKTLKQYNAGTDIVACDIYPVNPGGLKPMFALFPDGFQGDLNNEHISQVGEYVDKMRQVTGPHRPLLMVLQAFAWEALEDELGVKERREEKVQYPTYAESRFMAFQSLIRGANGIIYWGSQTMPQPSQPWSDLKRVTREVADLAGPLAERAAAVNVAVDYQEMGHSVDDGVQILAKEHAGKLYLFTCNADKNLCKATLSGLGAWNACSVLGENRTTPVEQGAITDTWRRFDVHVYEFSK
jgi:hypothetical protein